MKRRGNNEGTITKRPDGRWMGRLAMPDGSRRTVYARTRTEVQEKLRALQKEADRVRLLAPSETYRNLGEFFQAWLLNVASSVKPTTAAYYQNYVRRYIEDLFPLAPDQLKPAHIQKLYAALLQKGLSSTTVRHLHAVLHRAFSSGVRQGVFVQNICDLIDPPRVAQHTWNAFTPEEARQFAEAIKGERYEALFALAISTGMRQGELLGLTWDDVDLTRGTIQVRRNLQWLQGKSFIQEPKSATSRRIVYLGQSALDALKKHMLRQQEQRDALAKTWDTRWNLIFRNASGGAMHPSPLVHHHFEPLLKRAGLRDIRFHDLRHTAATLLLIAGINPKIVSEMLGHSSVTITLSLYSHVTPAMHRSASTIMEQILTGWNPLELAEGEEKIGS